MLELAFPLAMRHRQSAFPGRRGEMGQAHFLAEFKLSLASLIPICIKKAGGDANAVKLSVIPAKAGIQESRIY
jgi:hypothetical protein